MSRCVDGATIHESRMVISYNAIPWPLPPAWRDELVNAADMGIDAIEAVEIRMRSTIGIPTTRPFIPPEFSG